MTKQHILTRIQIQPGTRLLVQSSQPTSNPNQTLNQKQAILQILIDEVAGRAFLLLNIRNLFLIQPRPNSSECSSSVKPHILISTENR
jgi:hypothetical protein